MGFESTRPDHFFPQDAVIHTLVELRLGLSSQGATRQLVIAPPPQVNAEAVRRLRDQ